jgi:hypothetical protein
MLKLSVYSQSFLDSYKKYRLEKATTIPNSKTRKNIQNYIKSHISELDTIFQSYKSKKNFDFNKADTLFLIYNAPAESLFTSDIIIWSGKDTISYKQSFEMVKPNKYKRIITYASFRSTIDKPIGLKVITERDSLITLVSERNYNTINHLGDNQNISDGSYVNIYVAYKKDGEYKIESCSPQQFVIMTIYRKE